MNILQPRIDDKHLDSLWYDGLIAETEHYELLASGEIRINRIDKDGNCIGTFDGKSRDDFGDIVDDEDICLIFNSYEYYIDMNNWFEIVEKDNDEPGEVYDNYDSGIEMLKDLEADYVSV